MCFSRFAGLNSATTCNEILDALYFQSKRARNTSSAKDEGIKGSDRQTENSVCDTPLIVETEDNIGNISTLPTTIKEGAPNDSMRYPEYIKELS